MLLRLDLQSTPVDDTKDFTAYNALPRMQQRQ